MKSLKALLPIAIIGVIVYTLMESGKNSPSDSEVTVAKKNIKTYGEIGTASSWPEIQQDFSEVANNISAQNYYLVLDGSGSMSDTDCSDGRNKITVAKESLKAFVSKLPLQSNVGIFAFDSAGIGERLPLSMLDVSRVHRVLDDIGAGGGTPLSVAISEGNKALTRQAQKQLGYGEYHLVVVTDGEANSGYEPDNAVLDLLANSPIVLHTVGFCIDDRHSLNQPGYTLYKSANDPRSLAAGLESVLAEAPDFSVTDFSGDN